MVAELEQLAPQPHVPPARVLPRDPAPPGQRGRRRTAAVRSGSESRSSAHEAATPAQDRVRSDHGRQRSARQLRTRAANTARLAELEARMWVGAAQHGDLVVQHEELDVLRGGRATQQQKQSEHLPGRSNTATATTRWIMPNQRSSLVSDSAPLTPHRVAALDGVIDHDAVSLSRIWALVAELGRPPRRPLAIEWASVAPAGILAGHPQHQGPDRRCGGWSAWSSARVGPAAGDELGVPAQQGSG